MIDFIFTVHGICRKSSTKSALSSIIAFAYASKRSSMQAMFMNEAYKDMQKIYNQMKEEYLKTLEPDSESGETTNEEVTFQNKISLSQQIIQEIERTNTDS